MAGADFWWRTKSSDAVTSPFNDWQSTHLVSFASDRQTLHIVIGVSKVLKLFYFITRLIHPIKPTWRHLEHTGTLHGRQYIVNPSPGWVTQRNKSRAVAEALFVVRVLDFLEGMRGTVSKIITVTMYTDKNTLTLYTDNVHWECTLTMYTDQNFFQAPGGLTVPDIPDTLAPTPKIRKLTSCPDH